MSIYHPFPASIPILTARGATANKVISSLENNNVSVVGRRLYGKSVLLNHVAIEAKKMGAFQQVVYWDLRHFTPTEDLEFFARMCETIADQLGGDFAKEAASFLRDKDSHNSSGLSSFLDILNDENQSLLLIMDGLDDPLSSPTLSKNVWDNLCSFSDKSSLKILAGSRARLRELCMNEESKTSDFFRRFEDPVTFLGAFDEAETSEFLKLLEKLRPLSKGARSEFDRQAGGIPILCAALARELALLEPGEISQKDVAEAASKIITEQSETAPVAFDVLNEDEQASFTELSEKGSLQGNHGALEKMLKSLGFIKASGGTIRVGCEILITHAQSRKASLSSIQDLFGRRDDYERNIGSLGALRLGQISIKDEILRDYLRHALQSQTSPKVFLTTIRSTVEHALSMVWQVESPDGMVPKFTSPYGLKYMDDNRLGLPSDTAQQLRGLSLLTDDRNGVSPKIANKKIYCLLTSLKASGDLGQHQKDVVVSSGFAGVLALMLVELAQELSEVGL